MAPSIEKRSWLTLGASPTMLRSMGKRPPIGNVWCALKGTTGEKVSKGGIHNLWRGNSPTTTPFLLVLWRNRRYRMFSSWPLQYKKPVQSWQGESSVVFSFLFHLQVLLAELNSALCDALPKPSYITRQANRLLQRHRPQDPVDLDFVLDETHLPDDILQGDLKARNQRNLVFAVPEQLELLSKSRHGTLTLNT